MAVDVADQFSQNFTVDSAAAMKQFTALEAMGDDDEKKLLRWLRQNMAEINFPSWLQALGWLDEMDNRQSLVAMNTPMLAIFGENDQLVPVSAAQSVAALNSSIRIVVMPGTGHAPHLSQPDKVAELVLDWVSAPDPYCLRKELIAASFGRAADSYDAFAQLQRDVGDQLMELIPDGLEPEAIADMGCGTGYFSAELANRYPQSSCLGVDLAEGMLSYGADHHRGFANLSWLCGDAESLPLRDGSFELIFSNFAFQWCQSPQALMAEQWRLLKPGGWLIFTTVGPGTLAELRAAWQLVDHYIHVNQFIQLDAVDTALKSAGFAIHQWQEQTLVRHHPQLSALTRELKAIGAHNVNTGRNNGLTGRRHIEALKAAYENFRTPEGLPSTWEILYVAARKVCQ